MWQYVAVNQEGNLYYGVITGEIPSVIQVSNLH